MAHAFISQLRTLFGFGFALLSCCECRRLSGTLGEAAMRFPMAPPRAVRLTADQANGVRHWAHAFGWHSIALAQAFQFELMLRQKDCVGEWVPESEPGESIIRWRGQKWLRGMWWREIDENLIFRRGMSQIASIVRRGQQDEFAAQHSTYRNFGSIKPRGGSGNGETNLPVRPVLCALDSIESDNLLTLAGRFALKRRGRQPNQFKFRSSKMGHEGAPPNLDNSRSTAAGCPDRALLDADRVGAA